MAELIEDISIITSPTDQEPAPRISSDTHTGKPRKLYVESYGCQMNFSDSEIVTAIMHENGFDTTSVAEDADIILLNTCAIRDNAELKIRHRLHRLVFLKKKRPEMLIGVLGCMAERLKTKLLEEEKIVDMVVGPDAYRDLPRLVEEADTGQKAVNVFLSRDETYADITPVRLNSNGVTAFISIMRGCDNMCSFCVVPFTRGRERSRDVHSIVAEATDLFQKGYREVTLLGQNVDSYKWKAEDSDELVNFAHLLEKVALVHPDLRVRFSTSHPKDITDEVLHTIKRYENICNYIHLPAQSGNSRILELMNRTYTREWYLNRIAAIRNILGEECGISTDTIIGFCTETEEDHQDTISLMNEVVFDYAYMFSYSERPGTLAAKKLIDDVPEEVKKRRLTEIIDLQQKHNLTRNEMRVGKTYKVLVEGPSKKNEEELCGRIDSNDMIIFPKGNLKKGDYAMVKIISCTSATLMAELV
jgi:tRNA-2-methylthio-N6-dimethylallyladenosine synthase